MKNLFLLSLLFFNQNIGHYNNQTINIVNKKCFVEVYEKCDFVNTNKLDNKILNIINVLRVVESNNNPNAIGDNGKAKGVLQIHEIYVREVNNRYGTKYTHDQMFDPKIAEKVTYLYMKFFIKYYKKKFNKMPTEKKIVQCHNFGAFQKFYDNGYYYKYCKEKINMDISEEIWIKGYENLYSINRLGEVFSYVNKSRYKINRNTKNDYCRLTLSKNGVKKNFYLHRLVAQHFLPNPNNKPDVNHKDFNKLNNSYDNLEWVTKSENTLHAYNNGVVNVPLDKRKAVICIKTKNTWDSLKNACDDLGISYSNAKNWLSGKTLKNKSSLRYI